MKAKISVIVPVHNTEPYLERCIDSILSQTYSDFELILVDNGSVDRSGEICDRYAENDNRVISIHQVDKGSAGGRNTGLDYVFQHDNSEWIAFIDSDDFVHPLYLEFLYKAAVQGNTDISSCSYVRTKTSDVEEISESDYRCELMTPEDFWIKDRTNAVVAWAKLYRLSCFTGIRYPEGNSREDEFTTYKVLFLKNSIASVWLPLYCYAYNYSSKMTGGWHPGHLAVLDAFEEQIRFFKQYGYSRAYKISYEALCEHSIKTVRYIKDLSPKYDEYLTDVRTRRRQALKGYRKEFGIKETYILQFEYSVKEPIEKDRNGETIPKYLKRKLKKKIIHSSFGKMYLKRKRKSG